MLTENPKSKIQNPKSSRWTRQTLPRLLVILGSETTLREEALAAAKAAAFGPGQSANVVTLHGPAAADENASPSPADILDEACTGSMFAAADDLKLVVVREAGIFLTDKDWREILERNAGRIPASATLILETSAYGMFKNTRFYKSLAANNGVAECEPLLGRFGETAELEAELERRARARGLSLSHGALLALLNRSAKNLGILAEELDKLALALRPPGAGAEQEVPVTEQHIEELCAATNVYNAFNFVDAAADRNAARALEVLGGIFDRGLVDNTKAGKVVTNEGTITMFLLGALTWRLAQLQDAWAALDSGKTEYVLFGELKVFGPRQEQLRRLLRKHSSASLRTSMEALFRAYLDLRVSGLSAREVLEQLVWKIVKS
ncbi:MAG: DNA polymerase III subunit delta [Planctomycetota bacterium]